MSGFDRLHPAIQHHIVNSLGWRSLRPLQEEAVAPILEGRTALLAAPTAGGKTEAAVFPLFSRMLNESWQPLSVLYVCPLKALINDLEARLSRYASLLGRRAALWHGDLPSSQRRRLRQEPPDLLLTTPESMEVMLVSQAAGRGSMFANLRAVVVDELHAFAGDDRGWHLLSVIERAARIAGSATGEPVQRIGLSATIGNPEELVVWLAGARETPTAVVAPPAPEAVEPEVRIDFVGHLDNAAVVISRLHRGEKRLVFCDSRARVESLAYALRQLGVATFVSHGSLGLEERRAAERAFSEATNCVIVATSTLELGIDVGDLDRVIQIDAPGTVASFLQRLGRTGRRPGTRRNLLFLATREDDLLLACALVRLWQEGFVEPLKPPPLPNHILAQQILTLVIQRGGLIRTDVALWVGRVPAFAEMLPEALDELLDHMLHTGLLHSDSGILGLGPEGERRFKGKAFLDLLSAFSTDPLFTVLHGRTEIGRVADTTFLGESDGGSVLLLGGRAWKVRHIAWREGKVWVEPTELRGKSLWPGRGQPLSFEVAQAIRGVLEEGLADPWLTRRGREALLDQRAKFTWLEPGRTHLVRETPSRTRWWTFAGLLANATLADHLRAEGVAVGSCDDLGLALGVTPGGKTFTEALEGLRRRSDERLRPLETPSEAIETLKFHFCVPSPLLRRCLVERRADPRAAREAVEAPTTTVVARSD